MRALALFSISLLALRPLGAWGVRGHTVANLAAVEGIPQDGPVFLKSQEAYIGHLGTIPDAWRSPSEPCPAVRLTLVSAPCYRNRSGGMLVSDLTSGLIKVLLCSRLPS